MPTTPDDVTRRLGRTLNRRVRRRRGLPAPQVLVRSAPLGIDYRYGDHAARFHATSVGKLVTALLVARQIDAGTLDWERPVAQMLPPGSLDGLFVVDGIDHASAVTVEHLLTHTSGLGDLFADLNRGRSRAAPGMLSDPDRRWTPAELIDEARALPAVGVPGERFTYSDPGYWVLGILLEAVTGEPLGRWLHCDLLAPLGMHDTALHGWVRPDGTPSDGTEQIAPIWLGGAELSGARALMADWSAGGIATTPDDLVRLQQAFHVDRTIVADATRERLLRSRNRLRPGIRYGAGVMTLDFAGFFPLLRDLGEPVGHGGASATQLFWHPSTQTHVVLNLHSSRAVPQSYRLHIAIAQLLNAQQRSMPGARS